MRIFTTLVLCLYALASYAQDYFPLYRNGINYYSNGSVYAAWITDSSGTADKTYRFQQNLLPAPPNSAHSGCNMLTKHSFFGKRMECSGDSLYRFINMYNSPVNILTNRPAGAWIAYDDGTRIVTGQYVKDTLMPVLGTPDSVQIILLQYGASRETDVFLLISQHYGFVQTCNFYNYPYLDANYVEAPMWSLSLVSNSTKPLFPQNITWHHIYEFNIGDEFHTWTYSYAYGGPIGMPMNYDDSSSIKSIEIVLNKTDYTDSIRYTTKRRAYYYRQTISSDSSWLIQDTVTRMIVRNVSLDAEPGQAVQGHDFSQFTIDSSQGLVRKQDLLHNPFVRFNDSCANLMIDGGRTPYYYLRGAGGPYYHNGNSEINFKWEQHHELVYYKKGAQTWGTPFPTNVGLKEKTAVAGLVSVFPNPAKNRLVIRSDGSVYTLSIYDLSGKLCQSHQLASKENSIDISTLTPGIYHYRVSNYEGSAGGKLVVTP